MADFLKNKKYTILKQILKRAFLIMIVFLLVFLIAI
jgi:hypothetical protein